MTFENSYWNSGSVFDLYRAENPERALIQPIIAGMVNRLRPARVLDFGCGDAYVERLIDSDITVDLFDKNVSALEQAHKLLNRPNCNVILNDDQLCSHVYDCIILSFVLVCVESEEEQERILKTLKGVKTEGGTLIMANTHPCFLQYNFAAFETSFDQESFPYLKEGLPYEVTIKQPDHKPSITFTDYHWTFSFWVNKAIECGFDLAEIVEVADRPYKDLHGNDLYPPFLIMNFR